MNVTTKTRTDAELEEYDYRDELEITVNGKVEFCVWEGEPEDRILGRDFNDCYKITDLMKMAYEAGMKGEGLTINGAVAF